jgi:hypothetical protein
MRYFFQVNHLIALIPLNQAEILVAQYAGYSIGAVGEPGGRVAMNWAMRVLGLERLEGVEALEEREEGREGEGRLVNKRE